MVSIAMRQSYVEISQRANGEMVIGATPIPAETSETARPRLFSNHAVRELELNERWRAARFERGEKILSLTNKAPSC